jgi:hypothetical protein
MLKSGPGSVKDNDGGWKCTKYYPAMPRTTVLYKMTLSWLAFGIQTIKCKSNGEVLMV